MPGRGGLRAPDQEFGHIEHDIIGLDVGEAIHPIGFFRGDGLRVFTFGDPFQHLCVIGFGDSHDLFKIGMSAGFDNTVVAQNQPICR